MIRTGISLFMAGPVLAGLTFILLPAFGHFPVAGLTGPNLSGFSALLATPGLSSAVLLSVVTGTAATLISVAFTMMMLSALSAKGLTRVRVWLGPFLSVPHAAAAFGLAFLIAPSGLPARLLALIFGWDRPPDLLIVNDKYGLAMIAGLVIKEVPFLILVSLAALPALRPQDRLRIAAASGYDRIAAWILIVMPDLYQAVRLPVLLVLSYSMTTVDVALILGPTTPAPLSVFILEQMNAPDLQLRPLAAAAAVLQSLLVAAAVAFWIAGEAAVRAAGRHVLDTGNRLRAARFTAVPGRVIPVVVSVIFAAGALVLTMWSFAAFWQFPDVTPDGFTLRNWDRQAGALQDTFADTALIGVLAVGASLILTLALLESGKTIPAVLLYAPLIVPQSVFLPGLQILMLNAGLTQGLVPVIAAHMIFVLPYVILVLSGPYAARDRRFDSVCTGLGVSPWSCFWRVRLPMLIAPVLSAAAIGFSVSVAQYLPTLLIGGGRITTLTTEALALTSGGDRRAIAVFAFAQAFAALSPFVLAIAVPAWLRRNRKGLSQYG